MLDTSLSCWLADSSVVAWPPSPRQSQIPVGLLTFAVWPALIGCSLAVLSILGSVGYQSLVLVSRLICCSLAALSSTVSDTSRSVNLRSLASLSSAVSDSASLSILVPRICCNVLSLLSELCTARLVRPALAACTARLVRPTLAAASICVPFVRPFRQRGVSFSFPPTP